MADGELAGLKDLSVGGRERATSVASIVGDQLVELVRPTPETKLGLTFGEFRGQVVIHQVFQGYPAENLKAGDFVHAVNGTPVTAEATATQLASRTGDKLTLRLRPPPGASSVCFDKTSASQPTGIELMFDAPSGRVRVEKIADGSPAKAVGSGLAVGDMLLAVNGVRAVDVETGAAVLKMVERRVELRVLRYGGDLELVSLLKEPPPGGLPADLGVVCLSASHAGGKRPPPCLTTAPHRPARTVHRLGPPLRTPERRLGIVQAYHGLKSSPQAGPRLRMFHFRPPQASTGQCMVGKVVPESPAARSGLIWIGYVIESINDRVVTVGPNSADEARDLARSRPLLALVRAELGPSSPALP